MSYSNKKHFADGEWADFVNGHLTDEQRRNMQGHLNTNCSGCLASLAVWRSVAAAAREESKYEVPAWAVQHVKNAFSAAAAPRAVKRGFRIPRLMFDSFWQPAAVGVRSVGLAPRQLHYKSGDIAVELRLEPEAGSERVSIIGQLTSKTQNSEAVQGVLVLATSIDGRIGEASTNQFGEFQLSFVPEGDVRLSFALHDGNNLSIPFPQTAF
jgi:hypothetical protein